MPPSALTPAYRRWLDVAFGDVFPDEPRATCADCAMCRPPEVATSLVPPFAPELKCCTYFPDLANFLVGRALRDTSAPEGVTRLRAAITRRAATPYGVDASPGHDRRYRAFGSGFGADPALVCPYLDAGRCAIWAHRNAVCQTWFCKEDNGVQGARTSELLARMSAYADERVAADNIVTLLGPDALRGLHGDRGQRLRSARRQLRGWVDDDGTLSEPLYTALWGAWKGREEEFFLACAARVDTLEWGDVLRIGGPGLHALVDRVRAALAVRDGPAPTRLRRAVPGVEVSWEETVTGDIVTTPVANPNDPALVARATWDALAADAATAIPALPADERRRLWRAGVLLPGAPDTRAPLSPDDALRIPAELDVVEQITFDASGRAVVTIHVGAAEVAFDAPDLLVFARTLYTRRGGFLAGETQRWSAGPPLPWERVHASLSDLLARGILERRADP